MFRLIMYLLVAVLAWQWLWPAQTVALGPGVMAAETPVQQGTGNREAFMLDDYLVTPLADFSIRAKLLSRKSYFLGQESDISPVDFALGWGPMSDEELLEDIEISQSGRWYRWRTSNSPLPLREISRNSANMHIIPADDLVADSIDDVIVGQVVDLSGYLVRVDADDGWRWVSSLTREDTGAGACELFYVQQVRTVY